MHGQSKKSDRLSKLLQNQSSLDTLRLNVTDFFVRNLDHDLHPELKIRTMFVNNYAISLQVLHVILQFGGKVGCLKYFEYSNEANLKKILQIFSTVKALTLFSLSTTESFHLSATKNTKLTELNIRYAISCRALLGVFIIFPNLR